jgi:hypothetical protein
MDDVVPESRTDDQIGDEVVQGGGDVVSEMDDVAHAVGDIDEGVGDVAGVGNDVVQGVDDLIWARDSVPVRWLPRYPTGSERGPTRVPRTSPPSSRVVPVERGAPMRESDFLGRSEGRDSARDHRARQVNVMSKTLVKKSNTSVSSVASATPAAANVPSVSAADVAAFVSAIDAFSQALGASFTVPQPEEVKHLPRARKEASTIVPMVADLSSRYSVASTAYPTDVTLAQQQIVNTLGPVAERIGAVQKLVGSIITVGQSAAWSASMVTYGLLKSEARGNAVLRNALQPVREKLRPTYTTEDGGKTKVRSRSKKATTAKGAAPEGTGGTEPAAPAAGSSAPPAAAPAATEATAKS